METEQEPNVKETAAVEEPVPEAAAPDFQSKEYKRSRKAYAMECTFEYFVSLLVTDTFLAKLLTSIGVSDPVIGVISSLIVFSQCFQLLSMLVVQKISNVKRFVIPIHMLGQLFFMVLYFVPFLPVAASTKTVLCIVSILLAYFGNYFVTNIIYNWGNSHVSPYLRATYSATKETISLVTGMVVTLVSGYMIDRFVELDNLNGAFLFSAISILIYCICDFVCLMLIKNRVTPKAEQKKATPFGIVLKKLFGNRGFVKILTVTVLWNVAQYTTVGFLGTYRLNELAYSVVVVQIINNAGYLARAFISRPFGIYSDKHTIARGMRMGFTIAACAFACLVVTTPATRLFVIGYSLLYSISYAGIGANMLNITYSYVPREYYVEATAIRNCVGGLCGFGASLLASRLLDTIQTHGLTLFGMTVYGQQVLALISTVILVIMIFFTKFVIEKEKVMIQ